MKTKNIPEILSPAGSIESLKGAVSNGCDAVYIGGKSFSARSYAENFSTEELINAIDFCHSRGVKVYIVVNVLYKDSQIPEVLKFVREMYESGVDAFIVQDIGIATLIKENFKTVKLIASTQMTAHNIFDVKYLQSIGFDRVVLSRELSMEEIKDIVNNCDIEIEVFAHGALCVAYSGQCLMSSVLGGRSGNRGACAGTCRLPYELYKGDDNIENGYLLSPKDLMTLEMLPEIVDLGVSSIKIEGRMKSPEYVSLVTKLYRQSLDGIKNNNFKIDELDIKALTQVFNRGGSFTKGYYKTHGGISMMSTKTPKSTGVLIGTVEDYNTHTKKCTILLKEEVTTGDGIEVWTSEEPHAGAGINVHGEKGGYIYVSIDGKIKKGDKVYKSFDKNLKDKLKKYYAFDLRKLTIQGSVCAKLYEELKLTLKYGDISVTVLGSVIQKSLNKPVTEEELIKRLKKTGNTPFQIDFNSIDVDEDIYIDISSINNVRRQAIEEFQDKLIKSYKKEFEGSLELLQAEKVIQSKKLSVLVTNFEQFEASLQKGVSRIYVEPRDYIFKDFDEHIKTANEKGIEIFIALPRISRNELFLKKIYDLVENSDCTGYLIRSLGHIYFLESSKKIKAIDSSLNIFNNQSKYVMREFDTVTISQELNINEIYSISNENSEIIVHGKIPLMTTHQCPIGLYVDKKDGKYCSQRENTRGYFLKDRKEMAFPILTDCENCVAFILNSKTLCMLNKLHDIDKLSPRFIRLSFTVESYHEVYKTVKDYLDAMNGEEVELDYVEITNGHFYRGVQ